MSALAGGRHGGGWKGIKKSSTSDRRYILRGRKRSRWCGKTGPGEGGKGGGVPIALVVAVGLGVKGGEHKFGGLVGGRHAGQQDDEGDGATHVPEDGELVDRAQVADRQLAQQALGHQCGCTPTFRLSADPATAQQPYYAQPLSAHGPRISPRGS